MSTVDRCIDLILDAEIRLDANLRDAEATRAGVSVDRLAARDRRLAGLYWGNLATLAEIAAATRLDAGRVWLILNAFACN